MRHAWPIRDWARLHRHNLCIIIHPEAQCLWIFSVQIKQWIEVQHHTDMEKFTAHKRSWHLVLLVFLAISHLCFAWMSNRREGVWCFSPFKTHVWTYNLVCVCRITPNLLFLSHVLDRLTGDRERSQCGNDSLHCYNRSMASRSFQPYTVEYNKFTELN